MHVYPPPNLELISEFFENPQSRVAWRSCILPAQAENSPSASKKNAAEAALS